MSELPKRLDRLILRLDHMGLRVEQALSDALHAVRANDVEEAQDVVQNDTAIDRQEVEIEKECIRLLALYQPAAIDLRRICFIIKVNSDLERVADLAAFIARTTAEIKAGQIDLAHFPLFDSLGEMAMESVSRTVRMLGSADVDTARSIIQDDDKLDRAYALFVRTVLDEQKENPRDVESIYNVLVVARSLERIGDLCTNIAEDIIFLSTGEIVRHVRPHDALPGDPDDDRE
jgi:phosphate transport system protein